MTTPHHVAGQRVRCAFSDRYGVVIESDPVRTLIEFEDFDEDEGVPYTHRKWLPTRHWVVAAPSPNNTNPKAGAPEHG